MKKIKTFKAESLGEKEIESVTIEISGKQETKDLWTEEDYIIKYDDEARKIADALLSSLPQSVIEPLLIKLMQKRISLYIGPMHEDNREKPDLTWLEKGIPKEPFETIDDNKASKKYKYKHIKSDHNCNPIGEPEMIEIDQYSDDLTIKEVVESPADEYGIPVLYLFDYKNESMYHRSKLTISYIERCGFVGKFNQDDLINYAQTLMSKDKQ